MGEDYLVREYYLLRDFMLACDIFSIVFVTCSNFVFETG